MSTHVVMMCGFAWSPKATVSARAFPMAQELVRRNYKVTLLISPYDNLTDSGKEYEIDGVHVVNIKIDSNSKRDLLLIVGQLIQHVRKFAPDLVHVFKPKGFSGTAGLLLELFGRWPVVVDCDDWEGRGGWNDVSQYGLLLRTYIDAQEKIIPKFGSSVTLASRLLLDRYQTTIRRDRLFYIPNGPKQSLLNEQAWYPQEGKSLKEKLGFKGKSIIAYAGHLNPADEPEFVINVFRSVVKENPSALLVVIGDGPARRKLQSMAEDFRLQEIHFTGWLDYPCYLQLLRASDVVFYPYPDSLIYTAKCSGKIIEFMCLGKPIITTAVGQNLDYIQNGRSGILVRPGDMEAACQAILRLISMPEQMQELGRGAQRRIWDEFSWNKLGTVLEQAYDCAIA